MDDVRQSLGLGTDQPEKSEATVRPSAISRKQLRRRTLIEKRRMRKINAKKNALRLELERELELSRQTAKKLQLNWESSIRESKLEEFREEVLAWEEKAMRQFKRKDEIIQGKLDEWNRVEEINHLIQSNLSKVTKHLADIFRALQDSNKLYFETKAAEAVKDFKLELEDKLTHDQNLQTHCENIMHATNIIFECELVDDYKVFVRKRNDTVNTEIFNRYEMRDQIVRRMKDARQQLLSYIELLTTNVLDPLKYENIRKLIHRQRGFASEFERLRETEAKHQATLYDLNKELLKVETISQRRIQELKYERSFFSEVRNKQRFNIKWDHKVTMKKLRILSSESYVVLKHCKKYQNFGEKLLSVTSSVRAFQTEAEKVQIWGDFTSSNNPDIYDFKNFMLTVVSPPKHLTLQNEEFFQEINSMRLFWRRIAIVVTQNSMLMQEKRQLLAENKKYTDFIRSMAKKPVPEKLKEGIFVKQVYQFKP